MAKVFTLNDAAYQRGSDYDIVMLYQVLLGRNPENSQVIQDHRANPFNVALHTFITSAEFRDSVLDPIGRGVAVLRHEMVPRPSPEQLNWLFSRTVLDEQQRTTLRQAANWEQFFQYLCSLEGFLEPLPPPPPRPAARPAIPFRPVTRATPAASPASAATPAAAAPAMPGAAEIIARLDRIEAMLTALTQPPAQPPALPVPSAGSGEPVRAKPSSRRQAR